jgi:hypothetical protein
VSFYKVYNKLVSIRYGRIAASDSPPLECGNAALCQKDKNEIVDRL